MFAMLVNGSNGLASLRTLDVDYSLFQSMVCGYALRGEVEGRYIQIGFQIVCECVCSGGGGGGGEEGMASGRDTFMMFTEQSQE